MASATPGPPAWSLTMRLRHRSGLEIRAAAENVLPGWGRGGERLSLLVRLRRCLLLAVTSQCGARPPPLAHPRTPPRGCKILRFLRSRWARVPRVASIWRRKKPPARAAAAAVPGCRAQQSRTSTRQVQSPRAWALRFAVFATAVAVASIATFRLMGGQWNWKDGCDAEPVARCTSWRCFLEFLEHPPHYCNYK